MTDDRHATPGGASLEETMHTFHEELAAEARDQDEQARVAGEALLPAVLADPAGLVALQQVVGAYVLGERGDWQDPDYCEWETNALSRLLDATRRASLLATREPMDLTEARARIERLQASIRAAAAVLEDPYDKP